jgi:hypothetical protein
MIHVRVCAQRNSATKTQGNLVCPDISKPHTDDGTKSLIFRVGDLVTLGVSPVFSKNFSFFKKIFFEEHPPGLPRVREVWEGAQRVPLAYPEL